MDLSIHVPKGITTRARERGNGTREVPDADGAGGLEKFFKEVGKPETDLSSPPPLGDAEIEKLLAIAPKYGIEIPSPLGP